METLDTRLIVPDSLELEQVRVQELIQERGLLTELVGSGGDGEVYKLTDDYVVKIAEKDCGINHEYSIADELYKAGISVPRPMGIFNVKIDYGGYVPEKEGFVMGFARKDKCKRGKKLELNQRLNQELEKCKRLGFIPFDIDWDERKGHNVLYNKKRDIFYLIDFDFWKRK
jgi:hypothetical protein